MAVPTHIAIIPDGNRRWAKAKGLSSTAGHEKSARYSHVKALLNAARDAGTKYLSAWAFSTENWNRADSENKILFTLLRQFLKDFREDAVKEGIRCRWAGRRDRVPADIKEDLERLEKETFSCSGFTFQLCFDYGGRDEILRAVNRAIKTGEELSEEQFGTLLDTRGIPDPDLIIRTSGEQRLSGLMPWQSTYAEFYFTDKHFPDFMAEDMTEAIEDFSSRDRRFGGA